eukprot:m.151639 g.151639  ORF g.151639 m.151639 type:complete len:207 (-) comp16343_c0_seq2:535-1155(-)
MAFPLGIGSFCNWRATKKHASKHLTLLFRQALPAGMAVAVVHFHHKNLLMGWRRMLRVGIAIVAMALLLSYAGFAAHCENKAVCNEWHSYLSPGVMLAFILLRNAHPTARRYHSWLFASVGKVSLELFLAQYHLWLAFDTQGLLVFIPGHFWLNMALTTAVFVVVANMLAEAFQQLCQVLARQSRGLLVLGVVAVAMTINAIGLQL